MSDFERAQVVAALVARLRSERLAKGMTLSAVASRSGLSIAAVQRIEHRERIPTIDTLLRITDALGLQLSKILSEAEQDSQPPSDKH